MRIHIQWAWVMRVLEVGKNILLWLIFAFRSKHRELLYTNTYTHVGICIYTYIYSSAEILCLLSIFTNCCCCCNCDTHPALYWWSFPSCVINLRKYEHGLTHLRLRTPAMPPPSPPPPLNDQQTLRTKFVLHMYMICVFVCLDMLLECSSMPWLPAVL